MYRSIHALFLAVGLCIVFFVRLYAASPDGDRVPLPAHCRGSGPIALPPECDANDLDCCGCTWGEVYFRGRPITGAVATLAFSGSSLISVTQISGTNATPTYGRSAI